MIKEDNVSGAGLDCLRDWTNNVQSTIPIYVAERDYEVGFFSPLFGLCYCIEDKTNFTDYIDNCLAN